MPARIVVTEFVSIDGVMEAPGGEDFKYPGWTFEFDRGDDGNQFKLDETMSADALLIGRRTYESFAGAWPEREKAGEADAAMAKTLGDVRKIVASRSPLTFTWRNSEQLEGDLVDAVTALKADPAIHRIAISGCVSIVRQLLDAGLIDELHLFVHPATAGTGLRLFDDGAPPRNLKLLAATPFRTGVVHLVYGPDPNPPTGTYEDATKTLSQD